MLYIDLAASANVQKKWSAITRIVITYIIILDFGPEHFVVVIMHYICTGRYVVLGVINVATTMVLILVYRSTYILRSMHSGCSLRCGHTK